MDAEDERSNPLVFFGTWCGFGGEMLIVRTPVNPENPA
jgi:hypothetical protein